MGLLGPIASKKLEGRADRCGTEDIPLKCNAITVFNGNCGSEAIRVW